MGVIARPWLAVPAAGIALLAIVAFVLLSGDSEKTRPNSTLASAINYSQTLQNIEDSPKIVTLRAPGKSASDVQFEFAKPAHGTLGQPTAASCMDGICTIGVLYTPEKDFDGTDRFTYKVRTSEGVRDGVITIEMAPQNDAPTYVVADRTEQQVRDQGPQRVENFATQVTPGGGEQNQNLTFKVEASNPSLFAVQPSIGSDGALTYTPAPNASGTTNLTVTLQDDGGASNGGTPVAPPTEYELGLTKPSECNFACMLFIAKKARPMVPQPLPPIPGRPLFPPGTPGGGPGSTPVPVFGPPQLNLVINAGRTLLEGNVIVFTGENLITISASGPSSQQATVTLTASAGFLTLGSTSGLLFSAPATAGGAPATAGSAQATAGSAQALVFTVGDGTFDSTMTFTGTIDEINAALNGMTLTLPENFSGTVTVTITVVTAGGTDTKVLSFTIVQVNDAPSGSDAVLSTVEGAPIVFTAANFGFSDPLDTPPNAFAAVRIATLPAAGTLTLNGTPVAAGATVPVTAINSGQLVFTPAVGGFGTPYASFTFQVQDNGGTASGGSDLDPTPNTITINVTTRNDAPSFVKGPDVTRPEDSGAVSIPAWATAISPGPPDEAGQTLSFIATNDNNALFSVQPGVAADGTLSFTTALNANGTATVTLRLQDNGGTANGGVDTSAPQTFVINLSAVNDPPVNILPVAQNAVEDTDLPLTGANAIQISDVDAGTGNLQVTLTVTNGIVTAPATPGVAPVGNGTAAVTLTGQLGPLNAALGGLVFRPTLGFNGPASIAVSTSDQGNTGGGALVDNDTLNITVNTINDAPSFVKGPDQAINEDAGLITVAGWATAISPGPIDEAGQAVDFIVTNDNNALFSVQPAVAPNGTLTYTTALNANGLATVTVRIHDNGGTLGGGVDTSAPRTFTINIAALNDGPANVLPVAQTSNEDSNLVLSGVNAIQITDPDSAGGSLLVTLTVTNGTATVPVTPGVTPAGSGTALVTLTGQLGPLNTALGGLVYIPTPSYFGAASIQVVTNDQGNTGAPGGLTDTDTLNITVQSVNDVPSFVVGPTQTVAEDAGAQTVANFMTAISTGAANEAGQALNFNVTGNTNPGLFAAGPAIDAAGQLTYTPAANVDGTALITVTLSDNGGTANGGVDTSAPQSFTINVTAANDPPVNTVPATVAPLEDTNFGFTGPNTVSVADDSGTNPIGVTLVVTQGTVTVSVTPGVTIGTNGTASVTLSGPLAGINTALSGLVYRGNADYFGADTLTVTTNDGGFTGGGGGLTDIDVVTINVQPVNDVPSFVKGADQTVNEDAAAQVIAGWATSISRGAANEGGQTLVFNITGNTTPGLFSAGPAIDAAGQLTYTLALNANGTSLITVTLSDNGGTADGGIDTSAAQTFNINVTAVNDAPDFVVGTNQVTQPNTVAIVPNFITGITPGGGADESGQTFSFTVSNDLNGIFSTQPAIDGSGPNLGRLTYTTNATSGTATVSVQLEDSGGTTNGGVNVSATKTFTITNNGAPVIADVLLTINEDAVGTVITLSASDAEGVNSSFFINGAIIADTAIADTAHGTLGVPTNKVCGAVTPRICTIDVPYTPDANYFGSGAGADTFTYTASDGVATSAAKTVTITITSVNDAPQVSSNGSPLVFTEGDAATAIFPTITVSDPVENDNISSGSVVLTGSCTAADILALPGSPVSGVTAGAYVAGSCTLPLSGTTTAANWELALRAVTYFNGSNDPILTARTATFTVQDTGSPAVAQASGTRNINITPTNDGPTLSVVVANTPTGATYTEDQVAPAPSILASATITDADDLNMGSATVTITANCEAADLLSFTNTPQITSGVYGACSLTLTGVTTIANWQTALANVKFSNNSQNPGILQRTVSFTVTDAGSAGAALPALTSTPAQTAPVNVVAVNDPPVAVADSFNALNNTELKVATAPSCGGTPCTTVTGNLMTNDTDPEKPATQCTGANGCTVTAESKKSTRCNAAPATCAFNNVNIFADGTFNFVSSPGDTAADSFTYTLNDNDSGTPLTAVGTVNITVDSQVIWYVNQASAAAGSGVSSSPFGTANGLANLNAGGTFNTIDGNGDIIFVYSGNYNTNTASGLMLETAQKVYGQPFGLSVVATTFVGTFNLVPAGGTNPVFTNAAGGGITFVEANVIQRIDINSTFAAGASSFGTVNAFTYGSNTTISNTTGAAFQLGAGNGTVNVGATIANSAGGTGRPLDIQGRTGGTVTISGAVTGNGQGVFMNSNAGSTIDLTGGVTLSTGGNQAFTASGGTLNVTGTNTITTTTATPLSLSSLATGVSGVTFASVSSSGLTQVQGGISLNSITGTSAVNIQGGTITAVSGSGDALNIAGGTAPMTIATNFSQSGGANIVEIDNHETNNITLSGTLTGTASNAGILISNVNSGTVLLSGSSKSINTSATANAAVTLTSNTGGTVNFTNGNLVLQSAGGAGFTATGGATAITVQGTGNTITSTTGTALNVNATTIGASGLTFQSISSNGATNGINLNTTGSGNLTVSGNSAGLCGGNVTTNGSVVTAPNAADCTGGVIQASTGSGISLSSVGGSVSLTRMRVAGSADDGIVGSTVNGLTLISSLIESNGNAVGDRGIDMTNLTGSGGISTSTIRTSKEHNIVISNSTGTLTAFNVTNSFIGQNDLTPTTGTGDDGIQFLNTGSGNMTISVTQSAFTDNKGDHFQAATSASATGAQFVTFSNNTLLTTVANDPQVVGGGITLNPSNSADLTFLVSFNNIQQSFDDAINVNHDPGSTAASVINGTISNNTIGTAGDVDSGSESSNTITISSKGSGITNVAITNNTLRQYANDAGIKFENTEGSSTLHATVTGNTVRNPGSFAINGIHLNSGATATDAGFTCLSITGNDAQTSAKLPPSDTDIRLRQRFLTTVRLPGYGGANTDTVAVNAFVAGNNPTAPSATTVSSVVNVPGGGGFVGGAACTVPTLPP